MMLSLLGQSLPRRLLPGIRRNLVSLKDNRLFIDGQTKPVPWIWLRDSCQCERCVHPATRQKLHRSSDIPIDISPVAQTTIDPDNKEISIDWPETTDVGDRSVHRSVHRSVYPIDWLEQHASESHSQAHFSPLKKANYTTAWTVKDLKASPSLWVDYSDLEGKEFRQKAFQQLLRYGILFVKGVDKTHKDNENCELRNFANVFGQIRHTFYGTVWDVKSVAQSRNIAYTDLNLDLHMDLLYFESPPRYQVLHSLVNRVEGGISIFVDAFERAQVLLNMDPSSYGILTNNFVHFHYNNDGHFLHQAHPTIELDRTGSHIRYINYSPPFQAPFPLDTPPEVLKALKAFSTLLDDPASRFEYTMQEGDAVIFDNRRVLHARTSFRSREGDNGQLETNRWLKGCYLEADALHDRARMVFS